VGVVDKTPRLWAILFLDFLFTALVVKPVTNYSSQQALLSQYLNNLVALRPESSEDIDSGQYNSRKFV
jgi:hypothetical protein